MLLDSKLPKFLWGYAILHANYMKNRTHTCTLPNKTPFEMVNHKKPNLHATHQWGSEVYVKIKQGDKLSSRATRAHWIRFSSQSDGHCIYWPESHKVTVERNILLDKEKLHRTHHYYRLMRRYKGQLIRQTKLTYNIKTLTMIMAHMRHLMT